VMLPRHASTSVQPVHTPGHASSNGGSAGGGAASGGAGNRPARPSAGGWGGHGNGSANGSANVMQDGSWSGVRQTGFGYAIVSSAPPLAAAPSIGAAGLGEATWAADYMGSKGSMASGSKGGTTSGSSCMSRKRVRAGGLRGPRSLPANGSRPSLSSSRPSLPAGSHTLSGACRGLSEYSFRGWSASRSLLSCSASSLSLTPRKCCR
jgi:hypothetical protein